MASDQTVVFTRLGYEYRYRIHRDDELLRSYEEHITRSRVARLERTTILEVRTNFISKPRVVESVDEITDSENFAMILRAGEEIMESERLGNISPLRDLFERGLLGQIWSRMAEYWLPEERIQRIGKEAVRFVNRMASDPHDYKSMAVFPVVLEIDVCTVQLQGEPLDETIRRSIKPDRLFPVELWATMTIVLGKETKAMCPFHRAHLMGRLPQERVEDVAVGPARMESCPICSKPPAYGNLLTRLTCDHIFHNHCIVRWLMNTKACPVCRLEIEIEDDDQSDDDQE